MKSALELLAEANSRVVAVTAEDAIPRVTATDTVFVDVRDSSELSSEGKIPGSVHIPRGMLEFALDPRCRITTRCFPPAKKWCFIALEAGAPL